MSIDYMPTKPTQTEKATPKQVKNNAGGYVFQVTPLERLRRFLILGSTQNTYYQSSRDLTRENVDNVLSIIEADPIKAIDLTVEISTEGRAPKNDQAILVIALASLSKDTEVRKYAMSKIPEVCRIPTHLMHLAAYREAYGGGWGRSFRSAIGNWYNNHSAEKLSFHLAKYQSRDGWSNGDLLRLSHPSPKSNDHNQLYKWAVGKDGIVFGLVEGLEKAKKAETEDEIISLISEYRMPFETVPTQWLKSPKVWDTLLPNLGYTALIRSLGRMAQAGYILPGQFGAVQKVCERIENTGAIQASRIHPLQIFSAYKVYGRGYGMKSDAKWQVVPQIVRSLNKAFYEAFKNVEATGKRFYFAIDCSGSMTWSEIAGIPGVTPRDASGVLAMALARNEQNWIVKGFTGQNYSFGVSDLNIHPDMTIDQITKTIEGQNAGRTDCAMPMLDAIENDYEIDTFVVITDNETWAGNVHPYQALRDYRKKSGINAKLVVIGMTSTGFTIANPDDAGMMDMVGFDSACPQILAEFAKG